MMMGVGVAERAEPVPVDAGGATGVWTAGLAAADLGWTCVLEAHATMRLPPNNLTTV